MSTRKILAALCLLAACRGTTADRTTASPRDVPTSPPPWVGARGDAGPEEPMTSPTPSEPAADDRLEIRLEIRDDVVVDRVPMRTAVLHFRNVGADPLRLYLPRGEAFRANISSLVFAPEGRPPLFVPEPRPHGYVVTEDDFHLLAPGEARSFEQPFTIDPFVPGPGSETRRLEGFEAGATVPVSWTYENDIRRWEGGSQTLDGITQPLFGGEDIPGLWLGELTARTSWTVPR